MSNGSSKELYVSSTPHETKVAMVEDDQLAEIYYERENEYTLAGSIYKGRVTRVLPGMQSAFVDIGLERDAFLYVSDFMEFQEDEDSEFTEIPAPRQVTEVRSQQPQEQLPSAGEPAAVFEGGYEEEAVDEPGEENGEEVAEQSTSEAQNGGEETGDGARRWRGRRRRRGGRRGRGGERTDSDNGSEESTPQVQAEAEQPEPPRAQAAPEQYQPIILPGESLSKYQKHEPSAAPQEQQPPREFDRRRERERERPRREEYAPLPTNYQPVVLPGESISKYRNLQHAAPEPQQVATETLPPEPPPHEAIAASEEHAALETHELTEQPGPAPDEPYAAHANVGVVNGDTLAAEPPIPEPVEQKAVEHHEHVSDVQPDSQPEQRPSLADRIARFFSSGEAEKPAQSGEHDLSERWPSSPAESSSPDHPHEPESLVEEHRELEKEGLAEFEQEHLSAPPPPRTEREAFGGDVEHEEIEEEEADLPSLAEDTDAYHFHEFEEETMEAGVPGEDHDELTDAIEETDEFEAAEEEDYGDEAEEFEEAELTAEGNGEGEETNGRAEVRASSGTAGYQQRARRPQFDRRGGRPQRGRRGGRPMRARRDFSRPQPMITDLLKEGQEVLIQIAKEPIGKKGARITSHIALPGRFLVFMPTVNHVGVSRKINSEEERQRLKRIVSSERENGHGGFIVRTAAAGIKEEELRADIRFLKHLWNEIKTRSESSKAPALIYHDLNLVERVLRDQVTSDFSQIWVDTEQEYERVVRFANRFQPSLLRRIKLYTKETPLFEQFNIQEEINKSLKSKVWLKSGGYIVINQTEALVAIDINTGKYVGKTSRLEDTIVKTNVDAIKEIVRQIRLRDLGGIIVIDFIDMDERKNRQKVMAALEEALKSDRAPSKVLQFNDFGLVAITRKRVKQSLERTLGTTCTYCTGTGFIKSVQTVCNEIYTEMRKLRKHLENSDVTLRVHPEVAKAIKANNGRWLSELEELTGRTVLVKSDPVLHQEQFDIQ